MKPGFVITRGTPADLPAIEALENAAFGADAFSRRQLAYLILHAKGMFYVAKRGNEVAGYLSFPTSERTNSGRIYSIAVASGFRGQGLAGRLIDRAIGFAREKGLKAIFLEVRTDNTAAIKLYEKKGFVRRAVKRAYYEDGADAFSMILKL